MDATAQRARDVLERSWVEPFGFSKPNPSKYPWQWLWDSCFHAIVWSGLGDGRGVRELEALLRLELPSGFLPHMGYQTDPRKSRRQWRNTGWSDITQPPMYGHALRVLHERGFDVSHLLAPATRALQYLLDRRLDPHSGLIRVLHPWETGCDDSNRWDSWNARGHYSRTRWNLRKVRLVRSLVMRGGASVGNPRFDVASVGFTALVAFNCMELAAVTGDASLRARAAELVAALERR